MTDRLRTKYDQARSLELSDQVNPSHIALYTPIGT